MSVTEGSVLWWMFKKQNSEGKNTDECKRKRFSNNQKTPQCKLLWSETGSWEMDHFLTDKTDLDKYCSD